MVLHPSLTRSKTKASDVVAAARHYVTLLAQAADLPVVVIDINMASAPPDYAMKVMASIGDGHGGEAVCAWARRFDKPIALSEVSAEAAKVSVKPWGNVEVWALAARSDALRWLQALGVPALPAIVTADELTRVVAAIGDRGLYQGGAQ